MIDPTNFDSNYYAIDLEIDVDVTDRRLADTAEEAEAFATEEMEEILATAIHRRCSDPDVDVTVSASSIEDITGEF